MDLALSWLPWHGNKQKTAMWCSVHNEENTQQALTSLKVDPPKPPKGPKALKYLAHKPFRLKGPEKQLYSYIQNGKSMEKY